MKLKANIEPMIPYTPGRSRRGALKLSSNENPLGPSPVAIEAIREAASGVHIYPDPLATPLRERLSGELAVAAERIIIGNGSDELMTLICAAYVEPGTNTVSAQHTFSQYEFATRLYAGEFRAAAMPGLRFDVSEILKKVDAQTRVVWLCNPNNPTGTVLDTGEITRVLEAVPESTLVVLDEAYVNYVERAGFPDSRQLIDGYPNLIALRTFSKIYGLAALRVGYGMAGEEIVRDLRRVKQPFNVSSPGIAAATAALDDRDFYEHSRKINREQKRRLESEFDRLGLRHLPSETNFIAVEIPGESKHFAEKVLDNGVAVRPLSSFGLDRWLRITVGSEEQIDRFLDAFTPVLETAGVAAD